MDPDRIETCRRSAIRLLPPPHVVADDGLACVGRIETLKRLDFIGTRATPEGVAKSRRAPPGCDVRLDTPSRSRQTP